MRKSPEASPLLPAEIVIGPKHQEKAQDGGEDDDVSRQNERTGTPGNHISSSKYDGQAKSRNDNSRGEEYGQFFTGVTGRICVVHHAARDAIWDWWQNVEEQQEQRPVFIIDGQSTAQHEEHEANRSSKWQTDESFYSRHFTVL